MRAVVIHEHGDVDALQLEEVPRPDPQPDEVLVGVQAVGLNHLDIWVRKGIPGVHYPLPIIPGSEVAGVVEEVGAATRGIKAGDEVVLAPGLSCGRCHECFSGHEELCRLYGILGETRNGGCAEYVTIPYTSVLARPRNLTAAQAAAMPLVFLTAWHMLVSRAGLRIGGWGVIHSSGH